MSAHRAGLLPQPAGSKTPESTFTATWSTSSPLLAEVWTVAEKGCWSCELVIARIVVDSLRQTFIVFPGTVSGQSDTVRSFWNCSGAPTSLRTNPA